MCVHATKHASLWADLCNEPGYFGTLKPLTCKSDMLWCTYAVVCVTVVQTQASNEAAKAKDAFYQKALQDLTLFKSKTNAALLQVCNRRCLLYLVFLFVFFSPQLASTLGMSYGRQLL